MKRLRVSYWIALAIGFTLAACGGGTGSLPQQLLSQVKHRGSGSSPIQHVVIIVQENRSFDNLFAKFPGAHGASRGEARMKNKSGQWIDKWLTLTPQPLAIGYDLNHCRAAYLNDLDGGKMDGFYTTPNNTCGAGPWDRQKPYHYVQQSDIQPYWDMADQWVLADEMFQTQGSGSFTAHQDLIRGGTCITTNCSYSNPSGSSLSLVDNPTYWPWGCDSPQSALTYTLNIYGVEKENGPRPCSNLFPDYAQYDTLGTLLDTAGVSWKYYTPCFSASAQPGCSPSGGCSGQYPNCNGSLLDAFDVIYPVRNGPEWGTNVSWPETNIFSDISNGALPAVSWVIPEDANSDHPKEACPSGAGYCDNGPSWVASVVDAIGQSSYWNSSVVIVLWDDWGGFYDNAAPPLLDKFGGLGFRVPMLVVSPYDIAGSGSGSYISHTDYEFASILVYIEQNWNLGVGALETTDTRANSIGDVFNYQQSPRKFTPIASKFSQKYFLRRSHLLQRGDSE